MRRSRALASAVAGRDELGGADQPAGIRWSDVHADGFNFTQVERSYTSGGTTTTEQYSYEYTRVAGNDVLQQVTLRRRVGSGSWSNVARAVYEYFGTGDADGGPTDLKTATPQIWTDGQWRETGTSLYRYYQEFPGSSSSSSFSSSAPTEGPREMHLLKYVVNPALYERPKADPNVTGSADGQRFDGLAVRRLLFRVRR